VRISSANAWQPRQIAKIDSRPAAMTSMPSRTSVAVVAPARAAIEAAVVNAAPIP